MATKAIYTKINDKYLKVKQNDIKQPINIFRMQKTHTQMTLDESRRTVYTSLWANSMDDNTVKTNKEMYDEMISYLTENKVLEINTINNRFVMYFDYSIYNEENKEIKHEVTTKVLKPTDMIYPLNIINDSSLSYKQVKVFIGELAFTVKDNYPFGILKDTSKTKCTMIINDIAIYQDLVKDEDTEDIHFSIDENSYQYQSHTISSVLTDMEKVYSTFDNGIVISAVEVPFVPTTVTLGFHIALDNSIIVYDDNVITNLLEENIVNNTPEEDV